MTIYDETADLFLAAEIEAIARYARELVANGTPRPIANALLDRYRCQLEEWRTSALGRIRRVIDEPFAPTLALH